MLIRYQSEIRYQYCFNINLAFVINVDSSITLFDSKFC